jgi:integrase
MVTTVAQQAVDAWRAVLAYGIERRELARNVAAAMKKVPRVHQEMSTYTPDEIRRVLRAADKDRNGHLWYLALSGLRRAEIAGLRWSDVDLGAGTITVMRNRARRARAMWSRVTPKHTHRGARYHSTRASLALTGPISYSDAD